MDKRAPVKGNKNINKGYRSCISLSSIKYRCKNQENHSCFFYLNYDQGNSRKGGNSKQI